MRGGLCWCSVTRCGAVHSVRRGAAIGIACCCSFVGGVAVALRCCCGVAASPQRDYYCIIIAALLLLAIYPQTLLPRLTRVLVAWPA